MEQLDPLSYETRVLHQSSSTSTSVEEFSVDEFLNSEFLQTDSNQTDVVPLEDGLESAAKEKLYSITRI